MMQLFLLFCLALVGLCLRKIWFFPFRRAGLVCLVLLSSLPVMAARSTPIGELEFKTASVQSAVRVISEMTHTNIIATNKAGKSEVTLFLRDVSVIEAIDSIARAAGLWYRRTPGSNVYVVMTTEEYLKDLVVFREERTEVFTLKYQNVVAIARTIESIFGEDRVEFEEEDSFDDDLELPGGSLSVSNSGSGSGSNSSRSNNRNNRNNNNANSSRSGSRGESSSEGIKDTLEELTPSQIALLEARRSSTPSGLISDVDLLTIGSQSRARIFVALNREHNLLFVRSSDDKALTDVRRIVVESDRPTPQVLLEMKVMSIELDDTATSAFDFSYTDGGLRRGPRDGQPPNPLSSSDSLGPQVVAGLVNAGLSNPTSVVFQHMSDHVRLRLQLLEAEGRVNILATPMLLASNNRAAKIFIGEQTVITTGFSTSSSSTGGGDGNTFISAPVPETEVTEVGNTLTILPSINADRTVLIRLLQEASTVNPNGGQIPLVAGGVVTTVAIDTIDTSTMEGTAMAKDGLTVVVGGMITETESFREKRVPGLSSIPFLGKLFTDTERVKQKEELVLLITPHVFLTPEEAEAVSRQRLDKLSDHSNGIDTYLQEWDRSRTEQPIIDAMADDSTKANFPLPQPEEEPQPEEGLETEEIDLEDELNDAPIGQ